jgi:hypothetical protein
MMDLKVRLLIVKGMEALFSGCLWQGFRHIKGKMVLLICEQTFSNECLVGVEING